MPKMSVRVLPEDGDGLFAAAAVLEQGAVEAADVGDQLAGDRLALEINGACRPDRGQQARGAIGRELPRGAAGAQIAQQRGGAG